MQDKLMAETWCCGNVMEVPIVPLPLWIKKEFYIFVRCFKNNFGWMRIHIMKNFVGIFVVFWISKYEAPKPRVQQLKQQAMELIYL